MCKRLRALPMRMRSVPYLLLPQSTLLKLRKETGAVSHPQHPHWLPATPFLYPEFSPWGRRASGGSRGAFAEELRGQC